MPDEMIIGTETCPIYRFTDHDELNSALPGTSAVKERLASKLHLFYPLKNEMRGGDCQIMPTRGPGFSAVQIYERWQKFDHPDISTACTIAGLQIRRVISARRRFHRHLCLSTRSSGRFSASTVALRHENLLLPDM